MRELLIATHNRQKLEEMRTLLGDMPFALRTEVSHRTKASIKVREMLLAEFS